MASENDLLGRLDERTKSIQLVLEKMESDLRLHNDNMNKRIDQTESRMTKKIEEIENDLKENYVRKDRFSPVERLVYGLVGIVLTAVAGALIAMVVNTPGGS